jgi:ubiquinone/menaquinone biosynthesis C-methylase UbiE
LTNDSDHFHAISEAFSRTAEKYDRFAQDHPNLRRMRRQVYRHFQRYTPAGARVLELNAGTGTDAVYLARQGYRVHATDIAPGMLARLRQKVEQLGLADRVVVQDCSFTELNQLQGQEPFDAVFSNLGGLNCLSDLSQVARHLPRLLRPGGLVTWTIMPPVCLWELALAFTGDFQYAFRRLSSAGTTAHLEGEYFTVYYFTPRQVTDAFGPEFQRLAIEGLSVFAPPAESKNLPKRHPRLYRWLCWLDGRLAHLPPFRGWGDFFIVTLRYAPGQ